MRVERRRDYRAYVLRCWQEQGASVAGESAWRFSVEAILKDRRRRGFDSLEALVSFLQGELVGADDQTACDASCHGTPRVV